MALVERKRRIKKRPNYIPRALEEKYFYTHRAGRVVGVADHVVTRSFPAVNCFLSLLLFLKRFPCWNPMSPWGFNSNVPTNIPDFSHGSFTPTPLPPFPALRVSRRLFFATLLEEDTR